MTDSLTFPRAFVSEAPTLYIGFSGVLNVGEGLQHSDGKVELDSGRSVFEFAPQLIEDLAPHPTVQLVLTTLWLATLGEKGVVDMLPEELSSRVCGTLMAWRKTAIEVTNWQGRTGPICRHARHHKLVNWFALGDDVYGAPPEDKAHFFCTDRDTALGDEAARVALRAWLATIE